MTLEEVMAALNALPPEAQEAALQRSLASNGSRIWTPAPGPQLDAYWHPADILLYGGQAGGGKTDLELGLAFTAHQRSLILRRAYTNLGAIIDRAKEIAGKDGSDKYSFNGSPPPRMTTPDKRTIIFGANQYLGDEQAFQGQAFDLKCFDEAVQFAESQIWYHIGWLRSTTVGQRTRAILATNPPIDADGDWIIKMFRPWLDITHPFPAKHGELRWYVRTPDGTDLEVDGPEPVSIPGERNALTPMSRSFIPSRLQDNPYLVRTEYGSRLDGLPEPLRSAVRDGNFMAVRADHERQVIPTQWVIEAQNRWTEKPPAGFAMTAMGFDPAGGGADAAVLGWRYGGWYGPFISTKGEETADGSSMAALVMKHRRDQAPVVVDLGGGYGGSITLRFDDNNVEYIGFNSSNKTAARTIDGSLGFYNKRAEAWWKMREALDPDQDGGSAVMLPHDAELRADLTAPTWDLKPNGLLIESKDSLRERLGRSTGRGDACVMALSEGDNARKKMLYKHGGRLPEVNIGFSGVKRIYRGH